MSQHPVLEILPTCRECSFLVASNQCRNWRAARIGGPLVGDLAELPQRCPGYRARGQPPPAPATPEHQTEERPKPRPIQTEHQDCHPSTPDLEEPEMIVSENTGGAAFTPCPAGSYLARCVRLIDMGTQQTEFQGETKSARKVLLAFEVLDDEARRDDGEPHVLNKRYTLSLHEKSALRKDLASWRGRDFTPEELKGFDLRNILGKDAFVSVIETTKGERTYSNIASIMKPPKGMKAPEGTCTEPLLYWDMSTDTPDWQAFAALHTKLAEQIQASPEFKRLTPPKSVAMASPAPAPAPAAAPAAHAGAVGSGFDDMPNDLDDVAF